MIEGFEKETHELTPYEENTLLPCIVKGLLTKVGEEKIISSTEIVKTLKAKNYKIDPARLRKIINHIRINNLIWNLVANGNGYYVAKTPQDCQRFIKSLDQRLNAITMVRDAMAYQLEQSIKLQKERNGE